MSAAELLNEYRGLRELWLDTGDGRYQTQLAYDRYWKQACAEGRPPDALSLHKLTPEVCIQGLKFAARLLGRTPSVDDYSGHADQLRAEGLPTSPASIRSHVGPTWDAALKRAGLR